MVTGGGKIKPLEGPITPSTPLIYLPPETWKPSEQFGTPLAALPSPLPPELVSRPSTVMQPLPVTRPVSGYEWAVSTGHDPFASALSLTPSELRQLKRYIGVMEYAGGIGAGKVPSIAGPLGRAGPI